MIKKKWQVMHLKRDFRSRKCVFSNSELIFIIILPIKYFNVFFFLYGSLHSWLLCGKELQKHYSL